MGKLAVDWKSSGGAAMDENSETFLDPGLVAGLNKSAPWQDLGGAGVICRASGAAPTQI